MDDASSSERAHFYEPALGHRLGHDPFKAIIAPRPIGWISTLSRAGVANLAPYSFFAPLADRPPILMFVSEGWKDTVANVEATGEFVWNMVSGDLADAMNQTAANVARDVDEFDVAGLAKANSRLVSVPRVAQSPASMECRLIEIRRIMSLEGELERWAISGQVVGVHINARWLASGMFDTAATGAVARGGYRNDYFAVSEEAKLRMVRP